MSWTNIGHPRSPGKEKAATPEGSAALGFLSFPIGKPGMEFGKAETRLRTAPSG
jgi:hypothetical protein